MFLILKNRSEVVDTGWMSDRIDVIEVTHTLGRKIMFKEAIVELGEEHQERIIRYCEKKRPRISRGFTPEPSREDKFRIEKRSSGRYSSRCTFTKFDYYPKVYSVAVLNEDSNTVTFHYLDIKGKDTLSKESNTVKALKGYRFGIDKLGLYIERISNNSNTIKFHPTSTDLMNNSVSLRSAFLEHELRIKVYNRMEKVSFDHNLPILNELRVVFGDSIRANNCPGGTRTFCRQHGFNPTSSVLAKKILESDKSDKRVLNTVASALMRHQRSLKRGYSLVSEKMS